MFVKPCTCYNLRECKECAKRYVAQNGPTWVEDPEQVAAAALPKPKQQTFTVNRTRYGDIYFT